MSAPSDADKTLNLILSRLYDMKAEEAVTIDLRGTSAFYHYMINTCGRAIRQASTFSENVTKAPAETGIKNIHF